jgi:hypothetical protein
MTFNAIIQVAFFYDPKHGSANKKNRHSNSRFFLTCNIHGGYVQNGGGGSRTLDNTGMSRVL